MSCKGSNDKNSQTMIQKLLQNINRRYKHSKKVLR